MQACAQTCARTCGRHLRRQVRRHVAGMCVDRCTDLSFSVLSSCVDLAPVRYSAIWPRMEYGHRCNMATCTIAATAQVCYGGYGRSERVVVAEDCMFIFMSMHMCIRMSIGAQFLCRLATCAIWPSVQYGRLLRNCHPFQKVQHVQHRHLCNMASHAIRSITAIWPSLHYGHTL